MLFLMWIKTNGCLVMCVRDFFLPYQPLDKKAISRKISAKANAKHCIKSHLYSVCLTLFSPIEFSKKLYKMVIISKIYCISFSEDPFCLCKQCRP